MKIALVHDWLTRLGGAERVVIAFHKIFPEAPIYTLFYDKKFVSQNLPEAKIVPSFLQKVPNIKKLHPWFKVIMPAAVESFDLSSFDLVISSSHEVSHGVLTGQNTKHICFYHSPSRLLWDRGIEYIKDFKERGRSPFKISLIRLGQHFLRLWDRSASLRPDIILANSEHISQRIKKYYGREAKVVYPPVEINGKLALNSETSKKDYFLIVSQLYPHKNIDLAIEAFKKIPEINLAIIGEGPEYKNLKFKIENLKLKNVKLLGFVPDKELPVYYQGCLAYLICNEEDFGISPVEAMSYGKPVLAYKSGGAVETIKEGLTGEFFTSLTKEELAKALSLIQKNIESGKYSPELIKKHSEKFGFERFKNEILDIIRNLGYNYN
ncbi:MAG: glycosyltransferase [Patescibacteria group bacterium]